MADTDPGVGGDGRRGLIAVYGQLVEDSSAADGRCRRLTGLIVDVMHAYDVSARLSRAGVLTADPTIALPLASGNYLMEVCWSEEPTTAEQIAAVRRVAAGQPALRSVLLSMSGFEPEALQLAADGPASVVLLDRSHIEAIICSLLAPDELLETLAQRMLFDGQPHVPLTDVLLTTSPDDPPRCLPPDRMPPPWPLAETVEAAAQVRQLLAGRPGWSDISGAVALDEDRLLVTTADGLIEIHLKRGTTHWLLPLSGCRGPALVLESGQVLALCKEAVVAWHDGQLTALAGGFHDAVCLLSGPDREPWLLSGIGPAFGGDRNTLALNRLGDRPGQQQSYRIKFDAAVLAAVWLTERSFYLAGRGHGAVVDLARSSAVYAADWIDAAQQYPNHVVAVDERSVLTASRESGGVRATVYRTDLIERTTELVARLALNEVQAMAAGPDGRVYLVGDVRGNDVYVPRPVIIRITMPPPALHDVLQSAPAVPSESAYTLDPYRDVRVLAKGTRRDYALDPKPIDRGGQATVTGALHKATGTRVAFKRLTLLNEDGKARMRREIEAAQRFGDSAHVVPVLDFSPAYDWFVMPEASGTAEQAAEDLQDTARLYELVAAMCDALRRPHQEGWIHRDLKPANILKLAGVWAVADWGLGRRPRGRTSHPGRTEIGISYGTAGFAAPELSTDAHQAGPQADIYSMGQIIGWAQTGTWPQANRALLPASDPWREIVRAATHDDPAERPTSVDHLIDVMVTALKAQTDHHDPVATADTPVDIHIPVTPPRGPFVDAAQRPAGFEATVTPFATTHRRTAPDPGPIAVASPPEGTRMRRADLVTVKGVLGSVSFDGETVTIDKQGYGSRMKGSQALPIREIERVIVKPATTLVHGYIQFVVRGRASATERRGGLAAGRPHRENPDSMSFSRVVNNEINKLKGRIETALADVGYRHTEPLRQREDQ